MRDDQRGPRLGHLVQRGLDFLFGTAVQCRRRLVEQEDGRPFQDRAGNGALLAMNGLYKQMWDRQSKGFADGEAPSGDVVPLPQTRPAE